MQLFCYCSFQSHELLLERMPAAQTRWIVREHPKELLAGCRNNFKSSDAQTLVFVIAVSSGTKSESWDVLDADARSRIREVHELEAEEESLLEEDAHEMLPQLVGGCY